MEKQIAETPPEREYESLVAFDDATFLSHLWVLGAYEVIRTVVEFHNLRENKDAHTLSAVIRTALAATKLKFEEIRMPLAKLQRRRETVYIYPWPLLLPASGAFGWEIGGRPGKRHFVLRRDISKAWFDGLSAFRNEAVLRRELQT